MSLDRDEVSWKLTEPSCERLRLGFIGAGVMSVYALYPALHFAPIDLEAVCDLNLERARRIAGTFGARRCYDDYQQLLNDEALEAVVVHMHPKSRHRLVLDALEAGKHVFVPKPPAMSHGQTRELSEEARKRERIVMVNFQSRFSYGVRQALGITRSPDFGPLTQYLGSFCSGRYDQERSRDYDDPIHAFLLDFTPHHLDLSRYIAGEIDWMSLYHRRSGEGAAYALAVKFGTGAVGTLQFNSHRLWWRNYDRIEVTGQGEYVVLDGLWSIKHYTEKENRFTENYRDERSGELTGDGYALREFVAAIRENREPISSIHDSVATMRLYQALFDAARDGREGCIYSTSSLVSDD